MRKMLAAFALAVWLGAGAGPAAAALNLDRLSETDVEGVKNLIAKLEPFIKERDALQNLSTLTFAELYAPLTSDEQSFLKQFETLDAQALGVKIPYRGMATGEEELTIITGQTMTVNGEVKELPPQFLPPDVYDRYLTMMEAMKKDLGRGLLIESGYRSSAYQLYLFVYYLQNHEYSIRETVKFVALPGYSEHGSVEHQAIDFISIEGINGEDDAAEFEVLPEYEWLLKNAPQFGFVLSYPRGAGAGITFEPWHWRFENNS